ncbi:MAG: hypothetical protein ACLP7P_17160 [Rhodomicrobium sp.]
MTQVSKAPFEQWLETARNLGRNSPASVACPCCGSTSLSVRDVEYGFGHDKGVQRYITCGCCGAFTGVNMKRAGEDLAVHAAGETRLSAASSQAR